MSKRKLPSQRNPKEHRFKRLVRLYTPIGLPVPDVPTKFQKDPDAYWKMMHEKVERSIRIIKELNDALDLLEETSPEFAKQLPWYENRQKWKKSGGVIDEDSLRIELLSHHQKDMDFEVFKNFDYKASNAYNVEEQRIRIREYRRRKKNETEKE